MRICDHMEDVFQAEYQLDGLRLESDYTKKNKIKRRKERMKEQRTQETLQMRYDL